MVLITIDGPSGVGKTAVGLKISETFKFPFLSIGIFYRAFAWAACRGKSHEQIARSLETYLKHLDTGAKIFLPTFDGKVLDEELYTDVELEQQCFALSKLKEVRAFVSSLIHKLSNKNSLVVEGRSAHKVFSNADCKIFLTASESERLTRNLNESKRIGNNTKPEVLRELRLQRDQQDQNRKISPLRLSSEMIIWDSTNNSFDETSQAILRTIEHYLGMKTLKLSVIIPSYNRFEHLKNTIKSLKDQTLPSIDYEVIVVDDGSTDNTEELLANTGFKYIKTKNLGPAAARNKGIEVAKGDILVFIDADIIVASNFLEKVQQLHARTNNLFLVGPRRHLPSDISQFDYKDAKLDSREKLLLEHSYCLAHLPHPWSLAYTCNISIPKYLLKKVRFDETFTGWGLEDIDFAYSLYKQGARFSFSRQICVFHQYHDRSFNNERFESWKQNLKAFMQKHSESSAQSFMLFEPVFDPSIKSDFFEVFSKFQNRHEISNSCVYIEVPSKAQDPVETLQIYLTQLINTEWEIIVVADEELMLHELFLPLLGKFNIVAYFPKKEWDKKLKQKYIKKYQNSGKEILNYKDICQETSI
ncbi:MAG: Cytidylate kinase [Chlamydiae bacterium]|nr:Cytidylate kinase [Chlamydiota bacterium]